MKITIIVVCALVSVISSEFAVMTLLDIGSAELTDHLFTQAVLPVVVAIVALQAFLLGRVYRTQPLGYPILYTVCFAGVYVLLLRVLDNPTSDILAYCGVVIGSCSVIFGLFWFSWRPSTAINSG